MQEEARGGRPSSAMIPLLALLMSASVRCHGAQQLPPSSRFSNVFQSHMVLQRDAPLRVWGVASVPQLVVTLCTQGARGGCTADGTITRKVTPSGGSWSADFPPQRGSTTPMVLAVGEDAEDYTQKLVDIVFGDVLLFS